MTDASSMVGKYVLVTTGTGGISKATATGLAALDARVGITGRDQGRAAAAAADIRAATRNHAVDIFAADTSPTASPGPPSKASYDTVAASRLWQASAALTGLTAGRMAINSVLHRLRHPRPRAPVRDRRASLRRTDRAAQGLLLRLRARTDSLPGQRPAIAAAAARSRAEGACARSALRPWAAAAERCTKTSAGSRAPPPVLRHGDDDLAACVPLLHAAQALGRVGQRVGPVEDRCELPGLDEPGEGEQLLAASVRAGAVGAALGRDRLTTTARRMEPTGPNTWPGEPPPLSTRVPVGVSARRSRLSGRLPTLSRITS